MRADIKVKTGLGWGLKCVRCGKIHAQVSEREMLAEFVTCDCDAELLEFVEDLFVTAVESGYSSEWGFIKISGSAESLFNRLMDGGLPKIEVYDQEDGELLGELTIAKMYSTPQILKDNEETFTIDSYDAISADVWLQLLVMGEIRFG